jgi:hypothetical protein
VDGAVIAAVISAGVAIAAAVVSGWTASNLQRDRLKQELKTEFMAEEAIVALLSDKDWKLRSFKAIKRHLNGFDDNALRQLLVRSGALCFTGATGIELWGLRHRNGDLLGKRSPTPESDDPA